jgi:O-antigen ligase
LSLSQPNSKPFAQFWLLSAFLLVLFLFGGSSRQDVQSSIFLAPISILVCALAALTLRSEDLRGRGWLVCIFGLVIGTALAHIIPVPFDEIASPWPGETPTSIWDLLDDDAGLRTISTTPENAWMALLGLASPLGVLLLGLQLSRNDLFLLLSVLVVLGILSILLGLLQLIGGANSPFYLYRITNEGSAVGFFANRNHAALYLACLFPLLAVFASSDKLHSARSAHKRFLAAAIGAVAVPLVLVTGSRSGLLISVIGICGGFLLYRPVAKSRPPENTMWEKINGASLAVAAATVCLTFTTISFSRAVAIDRLFVGQPQSESRTEFWTVSADMFWRYLPFGSGSGSFAETYLLYEPLGLLDRTYLNRAHNDWIEVAVTFGIPGIICLAVALYYCVRRSVAVWKMPKHRRSVLVARMASICLVMMAAASFSDYPLRTPALMGFATVLMLWIAEAGREEPAAAFSPNERKLPSNSDGALE